MEGERVVNFDAKTSTTTTSTRKKRHGARNQNRHKEFVKWLCKTFPSQLERSTIAVVSSENTDSCCCSSSKNRNNSGNKVDKQNNLEPSRRVVNSRSDHHHPEHQLDEENKEDQPHYCQPNTTKPAYHILDVAGGKGEVAARLCLCHNQRVVMVDPRPADIADCYTKQVLPKIPKKWQQRVKDRCDKNPAFVEDTVQERFEQLTTVFTDGKIESSIELQTSIRDATLLVGLHADGATEAIVDAALTYHKPFVVVPCCVFPSFFQQRTLSLPSGRTVPVRTHDQFCQYLLQKDQRFQMEQLPFEGRNIAIYWNGN